MKSLAILTSGGDAPGMNAAIRSAAKICAAQDIRVVGVQDGYEGLMAGRFRDLTVAGPGGATRCHPDVDLEGNLGGTLLGSARSSEFRQEAGQRTAAAQLDPFDGLIVIGGNGSLTGAHALAGQTRTRVIGIPASIDNDVGCTSTAIGVDTALNTIVAACDKISDTARAHRRAFIVEVMGRHSGYLAMAAGIAAGADGVLFREMGRDDDTLVDAVEGLIRRTFQAGRRRALVIKSEGIELPCARLVSELDRRLSKDLPGVDVRATVLGHLVRGGNPSYQDRMVAGRMANAAVMAIAAGVTDQMTAWLPQQVEGGIDTGDPAVQRFELGQVLDETRALLDGTSAVTQWRVQMMKAIEGALAL